MGKIDWDYAQTADWWTLEEFCEFVCPCDPSARARLHRLARLAIKAGTLVPKGFVSGLPNFHPGIYGEPPRRIPDIFYLAPAEALAWARSKGVTIPPELAGIESPHPAGWPWGSNETKLLRLLAAAGNRFLKNYDPSDPTTAATNDEVRDWLIEKGVAKRTAEIMASILRPDDLPSGPRK